MRIAIYRLAVMPALLSAALLFLPTSAHAEHVITPHEVASCSDCTFGDMVIDASRGFPMVLAVLLAGENNEYAQGLLFTPPLVYTQQTVTGGGRIPVEAYWDKTELNFYPDIMGPPKGLALSACLDAALVPGCAQTVNAALVGQDADGQGKAAVFNVPLGQDSNPKDAPQRTLKDIAGMEQKIYQLSAAFNPVDGGLDVSWWDMNSLWYATDRGDGDQSMDPSQVDSNNDWLNEVQLPASVGYWDDIYRPYVSYMDGTPDKVKTYAPAHTGDDGATHPDESFETNVDTISADPSDGVQVKADQAGDAPAATVATAEDAVRFEDLERAEGSIQTVRRFFITEEAISDAVYVKNSQRGYMINRLVGDSEVLIVVNKKDANGEIVDQGHLWIEVDENYVFRGTALGTDGHLHLGFYRYANLGADNEVKYIIMYELAIDESQVEWQGG